LVQFKFFPLEPTDDNPSHTMLLLAAAVVVFVMEFA
jgi:hypothetical protein